MDGIADDEIVDAYVDVEEWLQDESGEAHEDEIDAEK